MIARPHPRSMPTPHADRVRLSILLALSSGPRSAESIVASILPSARLESVAGADAALASLCIGGWIQPLFARIHKTEGEQEGNVDANADVLYRLRSKSIRCLRSLIARPPLFLPVAGESIRIAVPTFPAGPFRPVRILAGFRAVR